MRRASMHICTAKFEQHCRMNPCEVILTLVVVGRHLVLEEFFNVLAFPPVFLGGTLPHEVQGKLSLVVDHHHLCAPLQQQADLKVHTIVIILRGQSKMSTDTDRDPTNWIDRSLIIKENQNYSTG